MCNFSNDEDRFGYIVDTPEIRGLIDETQRLMREITDDAERVEALQPAFAKLLGADGWLPEQYGSPDLESGMGGGIGQYALYRAEDGSLCLFSLVIPAGASTPIHDHLAWGLIGVYRGEQAETIYQRMDDGDDENRADDDVLQRRVHADHGHPRLQRLHDQRADDRAVDRADAALQRGAADDGGGDYPQFVQNPDIIGVIGQARGCHDRRNGAENAK